MIESRAALLRQPGGPLNVETVNYAEPAAREVVVRIVATSICHSDLHTIANGAPHLPMIIGHEAAGVVEQIGPAVTDLTEGQKVALSFVPSCGSCWACLRGLQVECVRGTGIGGDGRALDGTYKARPASGEDVGQMVRLGAFSERIVVDRDSCVPVPESVDLVVAALMSCGFVTGAGSVLNVAQTRPGDSVVVAGTGGVGLAAVQAAALAGAAHVIAVDVNADKLALAKTLGATDAVDASDKNWPDRVIELTGGHGADQAISCVGALSDQHLTELMASVRGAGTAVLVGAGRASLDVFAMGRKAVTRTLYGSLNPKADQIRLLELYLAGKFKIEELISRRYDLDGINRAIGDLRSGANVRGVIWMES